MSRAKACLAIVLASFAGHALATDEAMKQLTPLTTGKQLFDRWCGGCHEPLPGHGFDPPAGTYRLQKKYGDRLPAALEQRTDLQPGLIRTVVRNGVNMMPRTRKTELSDRELEEIVNYLTKKDAPH